MHKKTPRAQPLAGIESSSTRQPLTVDTQRDRSTESPRAQFVRSVRGLPASEQVQRLRPSPPLLLAGYGDGPTLAELAATYEAAGNRTRAVEYYLAAAAKGVATGDVLAEFAADYAAAGEYDQALEIYDPLVENFPHNAHYLFGRSFVKQQLGEAEEAAAGYRKVTQLRPGFAEAYYNLAALADAAEKASEAIRYYREYLNCSEGREDLAPSRERAKKRLALLEGS